MTDLIQRFISLDVRNLQLDIFRENGQVLLQVFKYSDVLTWENSIDFGNYQEGFVIAIRFSNGKMNNKMNLRNFFDSELRSRFINTKAFGANAYYTFLTTEITAREFEDFINNVLHDVYGELLKIDVQLNAY